MEISQASNLRFGWTERNRPEYEVKLKKEDLRDLEQAIPTDAFVKKVGEKLVGNEDSAPRFVLLSDAKETLSADKPETIERTRQFQRNLMEKLISYFKKNNPEIFALKHPLSSQPPVVGDKLEITIGEGDVNPYPRHKDKQGTLSPMFTHWDFYKWPIISMQYGKPVNVMGGLPRVFDARQMARDKNKSILDLVDLGKLKEKNYTTLLPPSAEMFEKYSIPFDPESEPLLILNNTLEAGIGHGVTTVYPKKTGELVDRPLYRFQMDLKERKKAEEIPENK